MTPEVLLQAYAMGLFPMAESRDAPDLHWVDPRHRGIIPLDGFHISRSLRRHILTCGWTVTTDSAFAEVMAACAAREETWINPEITALYGALHAMGHAHSLELRAEGRLVGGVYGVVLGAAFFGESMFSAETNGSKTALAWLVHRLRAGGFTLFDTQFLTPHLVSLGAVEIPRATYRARLSEAIRQPATFRPSGYQPSPSSVAGASPSGISPTPSGSRHSSTQTS